MPAPNFRGGPGQVPPPPPPGRHPPLGRHPPPGRHPPRQAPPLAGTPPAGTPPGRHPPKGYGQSSAGTHPTGMHSCFYSVYGGPLYRTLTPIPHPVHGPSPSPPPLCSVLPLSLEFTFQGLRPTPNPQPPLWTSLNLFAVKSRLRVGRNTFLFNFILISSYHFKRFLATRSTFNFPM